MDRLTHIRAFLEKEPNDSFLNHALAMEYIKMGRDDEAEELFKKVLSHDPEYIGSYYQLGQLLERKQHIAEAKAIYEQGMKQARLLGSQHAYNELQTAYDELCF